MAEAVTPYPVIDQAYRLAIWTSHHVTKFQRMHRHTLGERLEKQVTLVLEKLIRARYDTGGRVKLLREANLELELLRFQYRMAKDLYCLPLTSFGHAAEQVNEIGKQVGGWLKKPGPGGAF